jgi:hypothetical protein
VALSGPGDEVPDDEEIVEKSGFLDCVQLVVHALAEHFLSFRRNILPRKRFRILVGKAVALLESLNAECAQAGCVVFSADSHFLRTLVKDGIVVLAVGQLEVAAFRDPKRIVQRVRTFAENGLHLRPGFEVELARRHAHALGILNAGSGLDAEQGILSLPVPGLDVMGVIRRDDGHSGLVRQAEKLGKDLRLLGHAVVPDFNKKRSRPKMSMRR